MSGELRDRLQGALGGAYSLEDAVLEAKPTQQNQGVARRGGRGRVPHDPAEPRNFLGRPLHLHAASRWARA